MKIQNKYLIYQWTLESESNWIKYRYQRSLNSGWDLFMGLMIDLIIKGD